MEEILKLFEVLKNNTSFNVSSIEYWIIRLYLGLGIYVRVLKLDKMNHGKKSGFMGMTENIDIDSLGQKRENTS